MVSKYATLSSAILFTILLDLSTADISKIFKCPCTFSVARNQDSRIDARNERFDILVESLFHPRSKLRREKRDIIEKLASRNIRVSDAVHSDSKSKYFKTVDIREDGLFRVIVRHHGINLTSTGPEYKLELHKSTKQLVCPVVLAQDKPSERALELSYSAKTGARDVIDGQSRIEGGLFAGPRLMQYLVSIKLPCDPPEPDCYFACTGTLLSPRWVMTAAHCSIPVGSMVYISSDQRFKGFAVRVKNTIGHPKFETSDRARRNQFDIAVLELDQSVQDCCANDPKFMAVDLSSSFPQPGAFARTAGHGRTGDSASAAMDPTDGALRSVDIPLVKGKDCRLRYSGFTFDTVSTTRQVCAGYLDHGGCDSCAGDSGGPLIQYDGNKPVLIGITSFGVGCGSSFFPGVYTRPSGHKDWLVSTGAKFKEHDGTLDQEILACKTGEMVAPYEEGKLSKCVSCSRTRVSRGGAVRACMKCPQSFWRDTRNGAVCSCRARKGFGQRRGRCRKCPAGSFSRVGQNECKKCKFGTFASTTGRGFCKRCPGAPAGSTSCASS